MSSSPLRVPGAKATLLLSVGMTMLGFWGVIGSAYQLTARPRPTASQSVPPEIAEEVDRLAEEARASHVDEGAAVANLLASSLLVIGSFLLSLRRESALWWAKQALLANVLYTVGVTGAELYQLSQFGSRFVLLAISTSEPLPEGVTHAELASVMLWVMGGLVVLLGLALVVVYLMLLRISRRPDVVRFVRREEPEG